MCNGCDRVVDKEEKGCQAKLAQGQLEDRFVDGSGREDGDDLFWWRSLTRTR